LDNFETMITSFKDYSELQKFSESQMLLICELQKKIDFLQEKNNSLESIINNTTPLEITTLPITNQELICREQLAKLKDTSGSRELSYEECKKVSEYSKILKDIENNKNDLPSKARRLSTTELLAQVNEETQ